MKIKSEKSKREKRKELEKRELEKKELQAYKLIEVDEDTSVSEEESLLPGSLNDDEHNDDNWFTPARMLALLTSMFFMVYLDRGVIASNGVNGSRGTDTEPGTGIQGEFNLTNTEDGLLSSLFMVGMMIASPIFSEAVHHMNAFRLLAIGMSIWTIAAAMCGATVDFYSIAVCRSFVGAGEAAIMALGAPYIDDNAPHEKRTMWLASFFLSIPVGYAVGYGFGGIIGGLIHWRAAFFLEALIMLPFVIFCFVAKPIHIHKKSQDIVDEEEKDMTKLQLFMRHLKIVTSHPVYVLTVAGYSTYMFVIGAIAYWGAKIAYSIFEIKDIISGIVIAITGIFGTILGGIALDKIGSTIPKALYFSSAACVIATIMMIPCFLLASNVWAFGGPFIIISLLLFFIQAPVNAVILWSVPYKHRALATGLCVICIHLIGDVPSPTIYGIILDYYTNITDEAQAYRITTMLVSLVLFLSGFLFTVDACVSWKATDYRVIPNRHHHHHHKDDN